jgi:hypothetical protein
MAALVARGTAITAQTYTRADGIIAMERCILAIIRGDIVLIWHWLVPDQRSVGSGR